jgi:class 3 adenylate cyclase
MWICAQFEQGNPEGGRFCKRCGAPRCEAPAGIRKTVTVLFCDLVGSTSLGDRSEPEVFRDVMSRYHRELRKILEGHGGSVEKFIGDAVMAVFGIPHVQEDDALRATRAAAEILASIGRLGLEVRIGVNTGEVIAGQGETLVIGDAVNLAARLEQAASPGEVSRAARTTRRASTRAGSPGGRASGRRRRARRATRSGRRAEPAGTRPQLLLALAAAARDVGDLGHARAVYERALGEARAAGDERLELRIALGR